MSKKQPEQQTFDRYPVALVVVEGNNTVKAGEVVKGYFNAGIGLWHTNRGAFLPGALRYANQNPCGDSIQK